MGHPTKFLIDDKGLFFVNHDKILFHINTCAPRYLYLSEKTIEFYQKKKNVIVIDEEMGMSYIKLFNNLRLIPFEESGKDENIMGLRLLMLLKLNLSREIHFNID
jgi:hypothetical protein